jgi:hypothetical protein
MTDIKTIKQVLKKCKKSGIKYGVIQGFSGSWGSGIGFLTVEDENGNIIPISCDNAPTVRALDYCFGGVIRGGHTAGSDTIHGKEIFYQLEDWGILAGFTPVTDATIDRLL